MWQWCICGAGSHRAPTKQEPTSAISNGVQPWDMQTLALVAAFVGMAPAWVAQNSDQWLKELQSKDDTLARLTASEVAALRDFEAAARRCLAELSEQVLTSIKMASSSFTASSCSSVPADASHEQEVDSCCRPECNQPSALLDTGTSKGDYFESNDSPMPQPSMDQSLNHDPHENIGGFDLACMQRMFNEFDLDGDGLINLEDFEQVLEQLGAAQVCGAEQIPSLAKSADANGDGFIDVLEFAAWLRSFGEIGSSSTSDMAEDTDAKERGMENDLRDRLVRLQATLRKANDRADAAEAQLSEDKNKYALELRRAEESFSKAETVLEEQTTASLQFWRMLAGTSSSATLGRAIDMSVLEAIGSGRYSFVVKSKRVSNGKCVVAKLMSLRWIHVAVNEWFIAQIIGEHPNILKAELDDVWLHADENSEVAKVLLSAIKDGTLPSKKSAKLPTHYVGLLYDFMNSGTVQGWMDEDRLSPAGLLAVMQQTACALAHMHQSGVSHNDVKPQNLLITRVDQGDPNSDIVVKLADLGLGAKSIDHSKDNSHFVMTVFCMATGEHFGAYKLNTVMDHQGQLQSEFLSTLIKSLEQLTSGLHATAAPNLPCAAAAAEGTGVGRKRVHIALAELPRIARNLCNRSMVMSEVRDSPLLQGWSLSDVDV